MMNGGSPGSDEEPCEQFSLDHVGISVSDLVAASDWWCRAFNLRPEYRVEPPGTDLRGVMLVHSTGFRIELLHRPGAGPGPSPVGPLEAAAVLGFGHLCLRVADVPAAYEALLERGAVSRMPPTNSPARPGALTAFVSDPDGNLIEVLDRPGSRSPQILLR
jgi:catechol 2,3-dioxygenase-like lactoylglutathione lyase family enzyme